MSEPAMPAPVDIYLKFQPRRTPNRGRGSNRKLRINRSRRRLRRLTSMFNVRGLFAKPVLTFATLEQIWRGMDQWRVMNNPPRAIQLKENTNA